MALAPIPWNADRKTLREFSEAWLFVFGMVAAPLALWRGQTRWAVALWVAALIGRAVGLVLPMALKPLFLGMLLAGWPIGWVVSNVILAAVYFGMVTPIGLLLRLSRGNPLQPRFDRDATTYWRDVPYSASARDYLRQF